MAHVLICGITQSGKTRLARELCQSYSCGRLVCDPLGSPYWVADRVYRDPWQLLRIGKASWDCALFLDEAGDYMNTWDTELHWFATQSRHRGHWSHFICQRPKQVPPTVRTQCTRLFLFRVGRSDGEELAREWARPELAGAADLRQGECLYLADRFSDVVLLKPWEVTP